MLCANGSLDKENGQCRLPLSIESQDTNGLRRPGFFHNYEIDHFKHCPFCKPRAPRYSDNEMRPISVIGGVLRYREYYAGSAVLRMPVYRRCRVILPPCCKYLRHIRKRESLLRELSKISGVYIPRYPPDKPVVRQKLSHLIDNPVHSIVLTQDTELSDMFLIEVERGCAHKCRFCLVSSAFSPMRFQPLQSLINQAKNGLNFRKRIGLVGPAVTEYRKSQIGIKVLITIGAQISVSSSA